MPRKYWIGLLMVCTMDISSYNFYDQGKNNEFPVYSGEILMAGLGSEVTIIRDERGMPHIYASNEHDLYFASGFVAAQERLWEMDLIRRSFTGRLSEIFGKEYIKTDLFSRCLNIPEKSEEILKNEDPEILNCLDAYAEGVNTYISSAGKKLPPEFKILSYRPEPWTPKDIAGIIGLISWGLAEKNLNTEIFIYNVAKKAGVQKALSLFPEEIKDENIVFPDFICPEEVLKKAKSFIDSYEKIEDLGINAFPASNNWVVSGKKSSTGKPIFSNDMHLTISSPGIWMQMHQVIPGRLNVTGVVIPGEPFIIAGHNEKIAWGMTNMSVDDIDLFSEKIDTINKTSYFFNGEWRNLLIRDEIINVKGGKKKSFRIGFTHRGPLISDLKDIQGDALSMRWSGRDSSDEIRTCYLLNRAGNLDDFRSALLTFRALSQNIAYADVEGNIGLTSAGGIPLRINTGPLIRDGRTDEYDWKGYVPFSQLPYSYNPARGYVSSANNKTAGNDYPYYISYLFSAPYRINRIRVMLEEKPVLTVDDFRKIINDQHSDCAARLMPCLLSLDNGKTILNSVERKALDLLRSWDYDMNRDLPSPSIFEYFKKSLSKNLLMDEIGEELFSQACIFTVDNYIYYLSGSGTGEWVDNINTPEKETFSDIVLMSFREGVKELSERYGSSPDNWKWGRIHTITVEHPMGKVGILNLLYRFNSEKYPVGGSFNTVSMFSSITGGFSVNIGASVKNIYNTADWDESYTVIPTGQSGIPRSEFYLSQTKTYVEGGFYKDHFTGKAVKENAKYTLILKRADE